MATKSVFVLRSNEKELKDEEVYSGKNDLYIEAIHDGYIQDMIDEILRIPFVIREMNANGYGKSFLVSLEKEKKLDFGLFHDLIPYEFIWSDLFSLLTLTRPFKYSLVDPNYERYGLAKDEYIFEVEVPKDAVHSRVNYEIVINIENVSNYTDDTVNPFKEIVDRYIQKLGESKFHSYDYDKENEKVTIKFDLLRTLIYLFTGE